MSLEEDCLKYERRNGPPHPHLRRKDKKAFGQSGPLRKGKKEMAEMGQGRRERRKGKSLFSAERLITTKLRKI